MDGRVQHPVTEFLKARFGVNFVDKVTEPGPNRILAEGTDTHALASIEKRVRISIEAHQSVGIAVIGHHDCAGNPSPENEQERDTRAAVAVVQKIFPNIPVIGLWVDANWQVSELDG